MSIRKISVNNLPKGETFIIPIKRIKTVFSDSNEIGLFMTNDKYSFDSKCKKHPNIEGTVVISISYSKKTKSCFLHLYKIKEISINATIKESFSNEILNDIHKWIAEIELSSNTLMHNQKIYSVYNKKVMSYQLTWH